MSDKPISAMSISYTQVPEGMQAITRIKADNVNFSMEVRGEEREDGTRMANFEVVSGLPEKVMLGLLDDLKMLLESMIKDEENVSEEVHETAAVDLGSLLKSFTSDDG